MDQVAMRADNRSEEQPSARQHEFLRVFAENSRRLYGYILTLTLNHSDADEIYQTTSVVLWKKFDQFDSSGSTGSFYAWACQIARLEVLRLRRQKRNVLVVSHEVFELLAADLADRSDELLWRDDALETCLDQLAPTDRKLIEERYYHARPPKEIAEDLGRSVHAVYRSLARIHSRLFRCVSGKMAKEEM
jgi:RNA polymerase sigma-70 factor (ECF subfamily)